MAPRAEIFTLYSTHTQPHDLHTFPSSFGCTKLVLLGSLLVDRGKSPPDVLMSSLFHRGSHPGRHGRRTTSVGSKNKHTNKRHKEGEAKGLIAWVGNCRKRNEAYVVPRQGVRFTVEARGHCLSASSDGVPGGRPSVAIVVTVPRSRLAVSGVMFLGSVVSASAAH